MSVDRFLGTWVEESKHGFGALADILGMPAEQRAFFENSKSQLTYSRNGDKWKIDVGIVGIPQSQTFDFQFGEPYNSTNIDGTPLKSIIRQDGDTLVESHTKAGPGDFTMDIVRSINGEAMNATTSINGISMSTIYKKQS